MTRKKICYVVTVESAVTCFLLEQLRQVSERYDVALIVNTEEPGFLDRKGVSGVTVIPLEIERPIRPWRDVKALLALVRIFRRYRFDMVQSLMPKTGFLAMLAGRLAGVPVRGHIFTGQVWVTRNGGGRWFLKNIDRLIASNATHLLADSFSQRDFLIHEGVVRSEKISVLAKGSISGVDTARFRPDVVARNEVRGQLVIPDDSVLFMFLGRMNRDKGILDLVQAFDSLPMHCHLALVGPDEEGMDCAIESMAGDALPRIHRIGVTHEPWRHLAAADAFCLPSYREGFGTSVIEAAACGVPAVATRIYGLTDAVVDGETGLLVPVGDVDALAEAMKRLAEDADLRKRMGAQARERAVRDFSSEQVTRAWLDYYSALL